MKLFVASSNLGKLREYQALAGDVIEIALLPNYGAVPQFIESAPTFAENAAGKALHYSRHTDGMVIADDSGLVIPALDGAPGPQSARYAGPDASDADRIRKLLGELQSRNITDRRACFVCVLAAAQRGRAVAIFSDFVEGRLLDAPRGLGGFGYDPIFLYEPLGKTLAEIPREEKNNLSHRGRAFRKLLQFVSSL